MTSGAVLVETNWVVDIVAPAHLQSPQALRLLERAQDGEFELWVPAICFAEARETIPRRYATRARSEDLRKFVRWGRDRGQISVPDAQSAFRVFDQFDKLVANELAKVSERLHALADNSAVKVFPLSESMLQRQVSIGAMDLFLKPFDLAVLAAVIVQSEYLHQQGYTWVCLCELDSDLQPWDKSGYPKPILKELYDQARVWVCGDFLLEGLEQLPAAWPPSS